MCCGKVSAEGRRQERDENLSHSRRLKSLAMEFRYLRAPFGNQWIRALVDVEACSQMSGGELNLQDRRRKDLVAAEPCWAEGKDSAEYTVRTAARFSL